MNEKVKVGKPGKRRINRYVFLAMWVGAHVLGWHSAMLLEVSPSDWTRILLLGLAIGIPTAFVQTLSLYLYFGRFFRWWIPINLLAWIMGIFCIDNVDILGIQYNNRLFLMAQVLSLLLIPSLAQTWLLRKLIQRSWLWLISGISGALVFSGIMWQFEPSSAVAYPAFAAYAAVTGLTLLWLYGTQVNENKLKNIQNTGHLEDKAEEDSPDSVELGETVQRKVM